MNPSREFLDHCAEATGFRPDTLEKVIRLGEIADIVGRHPLLGKVLVLKGGTALNLGFGPPERLSVDLDYNYIAKLDRASMQEDRPRVEAATMDLARRLDYRVQVSADAFAGRKIFLNYVGAMGQNNRVEIDLNFLFREPMAGVEHRELWQPDELDRPRVTTVSLTELCIGKILAFLDRAAVRDAWDVCRLATRAAETLASADLRSWLIALSVTLDHPITTYDEGRVKARISKQDIDRLLRPMLTLDAGVRPGDIAGDAFRIVSPFLELGPHEKDYLEGVHDGELKGSLLFPDDAARARQLERHPAVLWKVRNVRKHLAGNEE